MILLSLARYFADKNIKYDTRRCPDEVKGYLNYDGANFIFSEKNNESTICKKLILILESPHKEEYKGENIRPAVGKTGENIKKCIINFAVLLQYHYSSFKNGCYEVWVVNAIDYQASLGLKTELYRTVVFQLLWYCNGRKTFQERIKKIVSTDDILINSCTKGNTIDKTIAEEIISKVKCESIPFEKIKTKNSEIDLRDLVDDAIYDCNLKNEYIRGSHPIKWDRMI